MVRVKSSKSCKHHHRTSSPGMGPLLTSTCVWEPHSLLAVRFKEKGDSFPFIPMSICVGFDTS